MNISRQPVPWLFLKVIIFLKTISALKCDYHYFLIIGTQIDYCCIKSFFRQIDPVHSAYLGLNEDTQQNNERKMHINAQVTAVIMMLEFLGNFHIVVIFMEWGELTRFLISYFFMLLHFLVLSYAHLKNTRGNKNRIIQYVRKEITTEIYCNI